MIRESVQELVGHLEAVLDGRGSLVAAVRRIAALRFVLGQDDNPLFLPFTGIDSESDRFPAGHVRALWSGVALERLDREEEEFAARWRDFARNAARPLLVWGQQQVHQ